MNILARYALRAWLNTQADVALLFGRKRRALELRQRTLQLNPRDNVARSAVGNLLAQLGDVDTAIDEFRCLVVYDERNADAWFNLGYLLEGRDALDEAERAFRRAIELNPKHDRAWYGLGLVLIRSDRLREATAALRKNTQLQPFSPYGWYQLAMTHHHLGDRVEAERIRDHLKTFEPRYAATLKRDMETTPPRSSRDMAHSVQVSAKEVSTSTA